jgi:NADPH2:quinone reductase
VPGGGGVGQVLSVGEGVDPGWVGRHVVARTSSGYAEQIVAAVEEVVEVPDGLGSPDAAAVLHDGVTALSLARVAGI